jgi:ketosteroid isomerase-like protein
VIRRPVRRRITGKPTEERNMTDANTTTVQGIYEAFGRGDVAAILDCVADDVDWASEADSKLAPWHGIHHGKGEVPSFFAAIGESVDVTEFTPLAFAATGDDVMAVIRFGVRVRATGREGSMELHHWWHFGPDGKVARYRGSEDTALVAELFRS